MQKYLIMYLNRTKEDTSHHVLIQQPSLMYSPSGHMIVTVIPRSLLSLSSLSLHLQGDLFLRYIMDTYGSPSLEDVSTSQPHRE